jgi:hypothetical protein
LHLNVGAVLEQRREKVPTVTAELAHHLLEAADTERAARYSVEAGDDAAERYAHAEAAH